MNSINRLPAIKQLCDQQNDCDKITNHRQRRQKSNKSEHLFTGSLPQVFTTQAKERILSAQINGRLMTSKGMRRKSARNRVILKENSSSVQMTSNRVKNVQNLFASKTHTKICIKACTKPRKLNPQDLWYKFACKLRIAKQLNERMGKIKRIK